MAGKFDACALAVVLTIGEKAARVFGNLITPMQVAQRKLAMWDALRA